MALTPVIVLAVRVLPSTRALAFAVVSHHDLAIIAWSASLAPLTAVVAAFQKHSSTSRRAFERWAVHIFVTRQDQLMIASRGSPLDLDLAHDGRLVQVLPARQGYNSMATR